MMNSALGVRRLFYALAALTLVACTGCVSCTGPAPFGGCSDGGCGVAYLGAPCGGCPTSRGCGILGGLKAKLAGMGGGCSDCGTGFSTPVSSRGTCGVVGGCGIGGGCYGDGCGAGGCYIPGSGLVHGAMAPLDHAKAQMAAKFAQSCEGGHCNRPMPPGMGPGGLPEAQVRYPYYTTRGPRDFLMANPPSIGP